MSILIQIDADNNDDYIELHSGQYYFDTLHNNIIDTSSNSIIKIQGNSLVTTLSWMNSFIVSPATKLTLYDSNQCIQDLQYTGSTYIISNYNTKRAKRISVNLLLDTSAQDLIDNVHYIVIEPIDEQRCKRGLKKYKDGINKLFIQADKHNFKNIEEPLITGSISQFTYNSLTKTLEYCLLIIATVCLLAFCSRYIVASCKKYIKIDNNNSNATQSTYSTLL